MSISFSGQRRDVVRLVVKQRGISLGGCIVGNYFLCDFGKGWERGLLSEINFFFVSGDQLRGNARPCLLR